ncbi:menaquinone-dependent protoporphyrinogen IX dehydrogenase [Salinimicrobium xinjiangense]|uniref:menaquinone-dependent protoporphyrinogen IX dehydrogenase n=1 Tax=Salinimicrobium xinjiangense TaxID=438596 RepID=UPI0006865946|nr:menaquinone-dependent protoporphyrinogen IX dehydrogenase [Salinimicrobium xinjiangense]
MKNIIILYSTVDGQTKKISESLAAQVKQGGFRVSVFPLADFKQNVSNFDTLVLGASIRYGKHNELVTAFINEHQEELEKIRAAFFSVNLVARKSDKNQPDTNPYVIKFLDTISWKPDLVDVFAGCLDYSKYGFFDRIMIKAIMKFTHGPTSTKEPIEYTDWERVRIFGEKVLQLNKSIKSGNPKEIVTS